MIFDIRKDKILFVFKRYEYNNNKILTSKNLLFLSIASFIILTRSLKFIAKNESNENNSNMNSSKKKKKKRLTLTSKRFKEMKIKKLNLIDSIEIDVLVYYYLARNKENKLFSLIINKIHDTFIELFEVLS